MRKNQDNHPEIPDVFTKLEELGHPKHVYICGAGPNGAGFYDQIPEDAYTMACNCLVDYPRTWSLWAAMDGHARNTAWWHTPTCRETKVLLASGIAHFHRNPDYSCRFLWTVHPDWFPMKGVLFNGGTTIGALVQLAYFMGTRHITLVGVDMKGSRHYDGSYAYPSPGIWHQAEKLQIIINKLRRKIKFDTMTPTVLKVPMFKQEEQ